VSYAGESNSQRLIIAGAEDDRRGFEMAVWTNEIHTI
jgi:hypothetical protein